jgi:hypothetical protein
MHGRVRNEGRLVGEQSSSSAIVALACRRAGKIQPISALPSGSTSSCAARMPTEPAHAAVRGQRVE